MLEFLLHREHIVGRDNLRSTDSIDMVEKHKPTVVTPNEESISLFLLLCKYK